jgi:hypothetical protein
MVVSAQLHGPTALSLRKVAPCLLDMSLSEPQSQTRGRGEHKVYIKTFALENGTDLSQRNVD